MLWDSGHIAHFMWRWVSAICAHYHYRMIHQHCCLKRLFIDFFLTKMSYVTSQNIGNPVQIIKYVGLYRFQPILKLKATFVESWFTLKLFKAVYWWFLQIQICDKLRALFIISNYWLCSNIDNVVWLVLKVINKILLMADVSVA